MSCQSYSDPPERGPIIWRRLGLGLRIQDLLPNRFQHAVDIIFKEYIKTNVIYKQSEIETDPESLEAFTNVLYEILNQLKSIEVVEEKSDKTIGILIMGVARKEDYGIYFKDLEMGKGKIYQSICRFINTVTGKVDLFEKYNCDSFLKYYFIAVKPPYRNMRVGYKMLTVGFSVARYLQIPVVKCVADNFRLQMICKKIGMEILYEIDYMSWKDDYLVFKKSSSVDVDFTCAVLAAPVLPAPDPEPRLTVKFREPNQSKKTTFKK